MKKITLPIVLLLTFLFGVVTVSLAQTSFEIHVSAGAFDRTETVVSFYFPDFIAPGSYSIESSDAENLLLQVDTANRGWFILDQLPAGQNRVYLFDGEQSSSEASISSNIDSTQITFLTEGSEILSYYHGDNTPPEELDERYKRGGYIHPVYSPAGVRLTSHMNVGSHPHQSGIWSAWTKTEFEGRTPDFWNIHLNSGRVDQADSLQKQWEGPVHGGFIARHFFTDISAPVPVTALNEEWTVHVYKSPESQHYRMFDLVVTQTVNSDKPLILPEYHYGGVGFRGHEDWINPENMNFLTAEGLGRDGHATRTKWTHIGGISNGKLAGITIMGHPKNFRSPQPVRIHPDAPFFNYAPTQMGSMRIDPGSPYTTRYRYVTYDGEPNPAELNRLWNDYAYPPQVTIREIE
jgi:hypothetical protein